MDEWREVPGWPGFHVTADGRMRGPSGRELRPMKRSSGHLFVTRGIKSTKLYVHRAVLLAFVGPCPEGQEGRHLNGSPGDNRLENLAWGTVIQQREDDKRNGVFLRRRALVAKMTAPRIRAIRRFARLGLSSRAIGDRVGLSHTNVQKVLRGERWSDVR